MKTSLLYLLLVSSFAQGMPPVLSLTQAALQTIDPDIRPDHYDIARTDLNADGKEGIIARRFPMYPDDQPESKPTGKVRQIQYKLHPLEDHFAVLPDFHRTLVTRRPFRIAVFRPQSRRRACQVPRPHNALGFSRHTTPSARQQ